MAFHSLISAFFKNRFVQGFRPEPLSGGTGESGGADNASKYLFISFSGTQWDGPWYVRQKLMSQFSKHHKVIYVNHRKELREVVTTLFKKRNWNLGIRRVNGNLLLVESPWIFPKIYKLKSLDRLINWLYHRFIGLLASIIGRDCVKILYLWEPDFYPVTRYYRNRPYIYHPYDLFEKYTHVLEKDKGSSNAASMNAEAPNDETELVRNAFLFYSVSELLCEHYDRKFGRRPTLLTNAVQDIYFGEEDKKLQETATKILDDLPKKKIAFSGSLIGSLNLDVIIDSSPSLQDYAFLFIGPIRYTNIREYDDRLKKLLSLKNVFQLGPYPVELLPYLLRRMDILVMIYSNDKAIWTHYSGPAKLFEYMGSGRPIVSTPHPAINEYKKYIRVVEDSKQFVSAVKAIESGSESRLLEEMVQIAKKNTWEEREKVILGDLRDGLRS